MTAPLSLAISREDLKALQQGSQVQAYQRRLSNLRCSDILSRRPVSVKPRTPLRAAWT